MGVLDSLVSVSSPGESLASQRREGYVGPVPSRKPLRFNNLNSLMFRAQSADNTILQISLRPKPYCATKRDQGPCIKDGCRAGAANGLFFEAKEGDR